MQAEQVAGAPERRLEFWSLVSHDGAAFLRNAYLRILCRHADPAGFAHFRTRLESGDSKTSVLWSLVCSPEGRKLGASIPGLARQFWLEQIGLAQKLRSQTYFLRCEEDPEEPPEPFPWPMREQEPEEGAAGTAGDWSARLDEMLSRLVEIDERRRAAHKHEPDNWAVLAFAGQALCVLSPGSQILDYGLGGGAVADAMQALGYSVLTLERGLPAPYGWHFAAVTAPLTLRGGGTGIADKEIQALAAAADPGNEKQRLVFSVDSEDTAELRDYLTAALSESGWQLMEETLRPLRAPHPVLLGAGRVMV
jgi:hypothetical protein